MEHHDLINELHLIEVMDLNDRIQLAKKRRKEQIENYSKWILLAPVATDRKKRIKFSPDTQLTEAVADGDLKELKELLDAGINPNCTTYEGLTPLHHSCIEGNLDIVNLLLMRGADVNARDSDGWAPLHAAATCGHKEIVELLVRTGADLLALNEDDDMAFQIADDEDTLYFLEREMQSQGITPKMADELRQAKYLQFKKDVQRVIHDGGDINAPVTANNGSFLHVAISHFYNDMVKLLLNNDASDTVEDCDGWRPIHVAAYWENMNAVEALVKYRNTDLTAVTKNGERPYDICEDSSCKIYILRILNKHIISSKENDKTFTSLEKICKTEASDDIVTLTKDHHNVKSNDDYGEVENLNSATLVNDRNLKSTAIDEENRNIKAICNPTANEIGTENRNAAIRGAKKHAPLIRALSFENNKELNEYEFPEKMVETKNVGPNDKELSKQNMCLQDESLNLKQLIGQRTTQHSFEASLTNCLIDDTDNLQMPQENPAKILSASKEAKQTLDHKIPDHEISSGDLLTSMLRLPNIPSQPPKNITADKIAELTILKNVKFQSIDDNSFGIKSQDVKKPNSLIKHPNKNIIHPKSISEINKNINKKSSVALPNNEIIKSKNGHKVLTRLVHNSSMNEDYIGLSEDTLYTLKQKRIKERNMKKGKEIKSKVVTLESQSSLMSNYSNHYKQFENDNSRRDPSIVKKSNKCHVM